jgi:CRISPR system Cascade subunit CasA
MTPPVYEPHRASAPKKFFPPYKGLIVTLNLITDTWLVFRRRSGELVSGSPSVLTDLLDSDPVVAIVTPRADFAGAAQEFLIGILSAAFEIKDEMAWQHLWTTPPSPSILQERFKTLAVAFNLDGEGPLFMQDLTAADFSEADPIPIEQILIDAPGEQTAKLNKDLFTKRGRVKRLSRPAAAMALLTLQTYAPAGGQGYRTSMRGGGPLTTLINPLGGNDENGAPTELPLWHKLWMNVSTVAQWKELPGANHKALSDKFPWLAPTRVSTKGSRATTAEDGHPLQAYFGMPRRIRLEFSGPGRCDLTGVEDEQTVTAFRTRNYGVEYSGWTHPLSPYYRTKENEPWLPVHGQPGGLSWRDWISLTFSQSAETLREPASVVARFKIDRARAVQSREVRLHAFGYDMDNMKARGWVESQRPLLVVDDAEMNRLLLDTARALSDAADMSARELISAGKTALFHRTEDARGDFSQYRSEVWDATESMFFDVMQHIASSDPDTADIDVVKREFLKNLEGIVLGIFDRWCPMAAVPGENVARLVRARFTLINAFHGKSKAGGRMFEALGLPVPESVIAKRGKKQRSKGAS